MQYVGISTNEFLSYSTSVIHKHTQTHILKPFVDSERTGLKVDIACTPEFVTDVIVVYS